MRQMSRRTWRGLREAILVPMSLAGLTAVVLLLGHWMTAAP